MIRFTFQGQTTDKDIPHHHNAIGPTAIEIAGWSSSATIYTRRISETTWVVIAQDQTVTAEVVNG